jgi:[acyl-carrier-protein] S-malonyltransferase
MTTYQELSGTSSLPFAAAGHSLGEYSALVAAESMSFEQALALVQVRGELMGEYGEGEMLATQLDAVTAQPLADRHYCAIGAINLPRQTVVGGAATDLSALAAEIEAEFPRQRSVRLKTEGAFHTYFMVEAARHFRPALADADIRPPRTKVLSNYTGGYHGEDVDSIRSRLFFQLFHPVNWIGCLQTALVDEAETFIEFGGGIGGGDSPAEKRPNLESVIKRAARSAEHDTRYLAAINVASIREIAAGD